MADVVHTHTTDNSSSATGLILGILGVLLILALLYFLFFNPIWGNRAAPNTTEEDSTTIDIDGDLDTGGGSNGGDDTPPPPVEPPPSDGTGQ